ncbi:LacI family DNA-binding transcriptional regulator [Desulfosporosinus burensis]
MQPKSRKTTIDEVAKRAKVSKTTVSRFINGRYEFMSDETRKRIQDVIEELAYRPNNLARSLKSNKSSLIGVIISDITNPFSSILVKGIGDLCQEKGYQIIIANTDNDPVKEQDYIQSLIDNRVEGLIVNTSGQNGDYLVSIGNQGIPIVLADRALPELKFDTIMTDNYAMTVRTIKHLFEAGFEKVAFFTEEIGQISTRLIRRDAFLDASKQYKGIDAASFIYVINNSEPQTVLDSIIHFTKENPYAKKAVFTVNGVTLLGVLNGISKLGLTIPKDIGVCGYDDWGWASLIPPGITAISQPSYQVGVESAKTLITRINAKRKAKPKIIQLPAELIIRGSTVLPSSEGGVWTPTES